MTEAQWRAEIERMERESGALIGNALKEHFQALRRWATFTREGVELLRTVRDAVPVGTPLRRQINDYIRKVDGK